MKWITLLVLSPCVVMPKETLRDLLIIPRRQLEPTNESRKPLHESETSLTTGTMTTATATTIRTESTSIANSSTDGPTASVTTPRVDNNEGTECLDEHEIMDHILEHYNRNKLPGGRGPVVVSIEVWIQNVFAISDQTRDFSLTVYMTEQWNDPGLYFAHTNPCKQNMSLRETYIERLWIPNLTFINSKVAHLHESPFLNFWLFIDSMGTLWMNYRMNLTAPCYTDLTAFPMDYRVCTIVFESYNRHNGEVAMRWHPKGAVSFMEPYPAGNWDELSLVFVFTRRCGWYIIQVYVPSYVTIFASWVSFTFGPKAIPARSMLGVNALLALTFQFETVIKSLPRVSYVKAIDVWMLGCTVFVFATMIELSIVGNIRTEFNPSSGEQSLVEGPELEEAVPTIYSTPASPSTPQVSLRHVTPSATLDTIASSVSVSNLSTTAPSIVFDLPTGGRVHRSVSSLKINKKVLCSTECAWTWCELEPYTVDKISMFLFPFCFSIFNLGYWCYYAMLSKANLEQTGH